MSIVLSKKLHDRGDDFLMYWCPGCNARHGINIEKSISPCWDWNGDAENPTFSPSVRHSSSRPNGNTMVAFVQCHYFITNGIIDFCSDSSHALAGQKVELPDMPHYEGL